LWKFPSSADLLGFPSARHPVKTEQSLFVARVPAP